MTQGPEGGGPPRLERVQPTVPGASRGLSAPEVTAPAAVAAGLPFAGDLSQVSALHLAYLAAAAQANGCLVLDADGGPFRLHFKRGVIENAAAGAAGEDLGRFLVERGLVSAEGLADAQHLREASGGDLVSALTQLQLLNPAASFPVLQEHGVRVVGRAMAADRGACRWDPTAQLPPSSFPLGTRWGLLCDAARRLDGLTVRKLLGSRAQRLAARAGGRVELSELKLTAVEARVATLVDGSASPAQLCAARPAEADVILRMALLLGETELVVFGAEAAAPAAPAAQKAPPAAAAQPAPTPAPAAAARPTPAPRPAAPAARPPPAPRPAAAVPKPPAAPAAAPAPKDVASLRAFHDKVVAADHFAALGVKREATVAQIKAAYFQLAKTYHPDAGPAGEPPEGKKLRADVFARLGEAWGVLGDEAKRAAYVQELDAGGKADVDVSAIFKAEELFQRATTLVKTRQYERALPTLEEAIKLNDEPEFGVWKAWVEFLLSKDQKKQQPASAAAMEAALKKVPRCMAGYLFLGQMAKLVGQLDLAEKHWKRGLALEPEHVEIARELKFLRR